MPIREGCTKQEASVLFELLAKRVVRSLADFFSFEFVSETLALVSKAGDLRSQKFLVLLSHVTDTHRHTVQRTQAHNHTQNDTTEELG